MRRSPATVMTVTSGRRNPSSIVSIPRMKHYQTRALKKEGELDKDAPRMFEVLKR